MNVLFVTNNISVPGNGICSSVNTTAANLRKKGVDVQFLSGLSSDPNAPVPMFALEKFHFPIFQPIIDANGFSYARLTGKTIREAIEWADILHVSEPLFLQEKAIRLAEKAGKPIVGTFHLYTQNILNEIPGASWGWTNDVLMKMWKKAIFDHCAAVQCPTEVVRRLLEKYAFKSRLVVISNGTDIASERVVAQKPQTDPYIILNIGRYANVKSQMTLLEAMKYSRHSTEIQIVLAGTGVNYRKLEKEGERLVSRGVLKYKPELGFKDKEQIKAVAGKAYLYVHCAKLEVEGLGCIEAVREGCVPLIGSGEYIGTTDFALDDRSVYPGGDAKALAEKIDWWIEHPEEREDAGQRYADFSRKFAIGKSIDSLIEMYRSVLDR